MTDIQSYDSAVARDAEASLGATMASLEANLAELTGFVNSVSANWEADERDLYRDVQGRWDSAAVTVRDLLAQVRTALDNNTVSVDSMRSKVASRIQS